MYSIRTNGDGIAQEFARLLGNAPVITKEAADSSSDTEEFDAAVDNAEDSAVDFIDDAAIADMIVDTEGDADTDSAAMVDDVIDNLETFSSSDPSGNYIMNGLGKIAGSLRAKGEAFAADVVEATALSIRGDLVKEAARKGDIIKTLNKMASDFSNEGDNFAADMVRVTVNKIS